jgi:hypothetical protein
MTIHTPTETTWADYFIAFNDANVGINKHAESMLQISSSTIDRISKIQNLTGDGGDSILMYYSSVSKSIQFLHNITDIGSKSWSKDPILVALNGFNHSTAVPVIIEIDSIFVEASTDAPNFTRLSTIADKESFNSLEAPDNLPQQFRQLPFILLPPFIWKTACQIKDKKPDSVFIEISKCIEDFIEDNQENNELNIVTKRMCSNIYTFLWAASKDEIPSVRTLTSVDERDIERWAALRHSHCIKKHQDAPLPRQVNNNTEFNKIAEAIELQSATILASTSESSKKGFGKLDKSTQNLILNAASPNKEIAAGSAPETCLDFYKQSSHGNARLHFIRTLKHSFKAQTEVSAGVITSIYNGGFTRSYDDSPSNFSTFSFPEKKVFAKHAITDCIILQLKEVSGKGLSNDDVEAALKQGIEIPSSVDSMRYSIFNIAAASKFFFGEYSALSQALIKVHNHIVHNRTTYLSILYQDSMFIAKFLFAIDTRVNLWLESCEESSMRDEVDDDLINFFEILNHVRIRNFDYKLPPSIRKVMENGDKSDKTGKSPPHKKSKLSSGDDQQSDRVLNKSKIDDWIVSQDIYNNVLRNNETLKKRPKIENTIMCHRFHSKGYCFENCNNKKSHIPSSDLNDETKKAYLMWLEGSQN